jgi:hypothetical protein
MKIAHMEAKRVAPDVVVISEEMQDETGCFVSDKARVDSIEGRYLHALAGAVADMVEPAKLQGAVSDYLLALDQWENTNKAERRVKTAELAMRAAMAATQPSKE